MRFGWLWDGARKIYQRMKEEKREVVSFKCKKRCVDTRRKNLYRHLNKVPRVSLPPLPFSDSSVAYFVSEIASEDFFDSDLVVVRKRKRNTCMYREEIMGIKKSTRRETKLRGGGDSGLERAGGLRRINLPHAAKCKQQQQPRRWTTFCFSDCMWKRESFFFSLTIFS